MSDPDLLAALRPVLQVLGGLGVRHFVGGSIASSAHGVARASVDADVVAELGPTLGRDVALEVLDAFAGGPTQSQAAAMARARQTACILAGPAVPTN
jgi:hypothetical protein